MSPYRTMVATLRAPKPLPRASLWRLLLWRWSFGHLRLRAARLRRVGDVVGALRLTLGQHLMASLLMRLAETTQGRRLAFVQETRQLARWATAPGRVQERGRTRCVTI